VYYVATASSRGRFGSLSASASLASSALRLFVAVRGSSEADDRSRSLKTTTTHVMLSQPVPSPFVSGARQNSNIYKQNATKHELIQKQSYYWRPMMNYLKRYTVWMKVVLFIYSISSLTSMLWFLPSAADLAVTVRRGPSELVCLAFLSCVSEQT